MLTLIWVNQICNDWTIQRNPGVETFAYHLWHSSLPIPFLYLDLSFSNVWSLTETLYDLSIKVKWRQKTKFPLTTTDFSLLYSRPPSVWKVGQTTISRVMSWYRQGKDPGTQWVLTRPNFKERRSLDLTTELWTLLIQHIELFRTSYGSFIKFRKSEFLPLLWSYRKNLYPLQRNLRN